MRGLPGDSESGEDPIMPDNSFKPTPLRGAAEPRALAGPNERRWAQWELPTHKNM